VRACCSVVYSIIRCFSRNSWTSPRLYTCTTFWLRWQAALGNRTRQRPVDGPPRRGAIGSDSFAKARPRAFAPWPRWGIGQCQGPLPGVVALAALGPAPTRRPVDGRHRTTFCRRSSRPKPAMGKSTDGVGSPFLVGSAGSPVLEPAKKTRSADKKTTPDPLPPLLKVPSSGGRGMDWEYALIGCRQPKPRWSFRGGGEPRVGKDGGTPG
jgi:hypothetical protein